MSFLFATLQGKVLAMQCFLVVRSTARIKSSVAPCRSVGRSVGSPVGRYLACFFPRSPGSSQAAAALEPQAATHTHSHPYPVLSRRHFALRRVCIPRCIFGSWTRSLPNLPLPPHTAPSSSTTHGRCCRRRRRPGPSDKPPDCHLVPRIADTWRTCVLHRE